MKPEETIALSVREATADDAAPIAEIYNHYVLTSTATFDTEPKSVQDRVEWLSGREAIYPVLVAERAGRVVGWAALSRYGQRPAYRHTAEVAVYVAPDARRTGVGSRLVSELVLSARECGFHALVSQIVGGNEASLSMAERCGFGRAGVLREVGYKFGLWLDVVVLELILEDGRS